MGQEMHTAQETFDHIVACLRKQGCKSGVEDPVLTGEYSCRYRLGSLRCAAGWCIDDERYSEKAMEDLPATDPAVRAAIEISGWDPSIAAALQRVHDVTEPPDWEAEFEWTAEELNLTYTPPEK